MADEDHQERALQVVATAGSVPEADLICQRLAEVGIQAMAQRSIGGPEWGVSGGQYVYVEAEQLDRAREVLAAPDELGDDELAKMAEDAAPGQQTRPAEG
jgi:hypothetical protein